MKNFLSKYLILIVAILSIENIVISSEKPSNPEIQKQSLPQNLEAEREFFEQLITTTRQQTEQISFCLQQILQALQANRLKGSKRQIKLLAQEVVEIQGFTQMILDKILTQINPESIQIGLVLNGIIAHYLIKQLQENPFLIKAEQLNATIDKQLQTKLEKFKPNLVNHTIKLNQKTIDTLLKTTDFIGLTWYNQIYRYLKKSNAYEYARFATVAGLTTFVGLCIYQHYKDPASLSENTTDGFFSRIYNSISSIIGKPGHYIEGTHDPKTGKASYQPGDGLHKVWDAITSSKELGILAIAPIATIPLNSIFETIYYQYWKNIKTEVAKRWKWFDEICSGSDKKYDAYDAEKVYFKDMTGAQHLEVLAKKITNFMKHPERYERSQLEEHRGILLYGPPQTGKTLFAKALRTMISQNLGEDKKISFIDAKKILDIDAKATIDEIFDYAKHVAPSIIFIDEIDLVAPNREKNPITTGQLLTCMQGVDMISKQIIVIGATNKPEQLDKALLVDGRFGKIIHVDYPNYHERKSYLEQQLTKRCLQVEPSLIEYIAQETEGASYNKLRRIIMESLILSALEIRAITPNDFEETLDEEIRKIKKLHAPIPENEKKVIATYQAGKALARHLLKTDKEIVKITIHPVAKNVKTNEHGWAIKTDNENNAQNDKFKEEDKDQKMKDGEVFTKTSTTNSMLLSDMELEKEVLALLAGNIAQKLLLGAAFSNCNPQDRAEAMKIIYTLVSQGEKIDKIIKAEALERKAKYEKQLEELLSKHQDSLQIIANKLIDHYTINKYEWSEFINTLAK